MQHKRDQALDVAKGFAIIGVVLAHVVRGLDSAGIIGDPDPIDRIVGMAHLTVFAFLSALFVQDSVARSGPWSYGRARVANFLYLYLVWTILQGVAKLVATPTVNTPIAPIDVLRVWIPDAQLWFLPWIALMTIAVVVLQPWQGGVRLWGGLGVAVLISVATWGLNGDLMFTHGLGLTIFYFVGAAIGARRLLLLLRALSFASALAIATGASGLVMVLVFLTPATPPTFIPGSAAPLPLPAGRTSLNLTLGIVATSTGVVAILAWSKVITGRAARWLAFLGRRSVEIFLAHILATSGTRMMLTLMGVEDPVLYIIVGIVAGVVFPLLLWTAAKRIHFPWLFAAPRALTDARVY